MHYGVLAARETMIGSSATEAVLHPGRPAPRFDTENP